MRLGGNRRTVADDPGAAGVTEKEVMACQAGSGCLGSGDGGGAATFKEQQAAAGGDGSILTDRRHDRNAAIRTSRPIVSVSPVEQLAPTRSASSQRVDLPTRFAGC